MNRIVIMLLSVLVTVAIPNVVFAQTTAWSLFQQLCQSGGVATGPQCQNLQTQQSNGSTCPTNSILQNGVCVPTASTTQGTCPTNSILQNGVCVPTASTTQGTCPT